MSIAGSQLTRLSHIECGGRPKGYVRYNPRGFNAVTTRRIVALFEAMDVADALPLGPRTAGYRLKELYVGEYGKHHFDRIEEIVKRLQQAGEIPWEWVADASAVTFDPGGWDSVSAFLGEVGSRYRRDRRAGQRVVIEICAEARETLPLIRRVAADRGVLVYSGGGSSGPNAAHAVAARALARAVRHGQSTLILGICDFDVPGIKNVLRPHLEHLAAFLYGTPRTEAVAAVDGHCITDVDAEVSFAHLALTPVMAVDLVELEHDRERIMSYIASGTDLWDRDVALLVGVQKIETEALDPVELRRLVADAIDAAIDTEALERLVSDELSDRKHLDGFLHRFADAADDARPETAR